MCIHLLKEASVMDSVALGPVVCLWKIHRMEYFSLCDVDDIINHHNIAGS